MLNHHNINYNSLHWYLRVIPVFMLQRSNIFDHATLDMDDDDDELGDDEEETEEEAIDRIRGELADRFDNDLNIIGQLQVCLVDFRIPDTSLY